MASHAVQPLGIPVVYLVDCSGLFLPEQAHTFPGRTGAGAGGREGPPPSTGPSFNCEAMQPPSHRLRGSW